MEWKKVSLNYEVSDQGQVKSLKKGIILKPGTRPDGYHVVNVSGFRHKKNWKIHQLVAIFFLDNPKNLKSINHKNGIKTTGVYYDCINEAAYTIGLKTSTLAAMLRGQSRNYTNLKYA